MRGMSIIMDTLKWLCLNLWIHQNPCVHGQGYTKVRVSKNKVPHF